MSFAEKLKQLRLQNNLTQEALGKRMNVSRSTIAVMKQRTVSHLMKS